MSNLILRITHIFVCTVLIGGGISYFVWSSYIDPKVSFRNLSPEPVFVTWSTVSTPPKNTTKVASGEAIHFRPYGDAGFDISVSLSLTDEHCSERQIDCYILKGTFGRQYVFKHVAGANHDEYVLLIDSTR